MVLPEQGDITLLSNNSKSGEDSFLEFVVWVPILLSNREMVDFKLGFEKIVSYYVGGLVLFRLRVEIQRQLLNSSIICVIADDKGPGNN